jgi:ParB family chromosome partitioning protein
MIAPADAVHILPLDQIWPAASNPRRSYNAAAAAELLESIRTHGILTPLLVRCIERDEQDTYEVVAGHRRLAAAQELGLETVPVTIRELTDDQARETAIVENLQREDLAPLDEAESYQVLLAIPGATAASVAAAVGKSPAYVGRRLKLLGLVEDAQAALREGRMDVARAELLTKLTPELQVHALREAVWMPMFRFHDDGQESGTVETLEPLSDLREWVEKRTRLTVASLIDDTETQSLFPEAAEAARAADGGHELHEVALDRFGQSPARGDIPAGVLRLNKDFREVTGKRCTSAARAIVVFGQRKGDVVFVCRDKKGCTTHWPPKQKADASATTDRRMTWDEQERERKRVQAIWARVKPDVEQVIIAASAKVKTTPKLLQAVLEDRCYHEAPVAIRAVGKLTPETFGRAWVLANALADLYAVDGAERALRAVNGYFDVKKAMKATEAAMAAEATPGKAAVKKLIAAEAKKPAGKAAKKRGAA